MDSSSVTEQPSNFDEDKFWETVDEIAWRPITHENMEFVAGLVRENDEYKQFVEAAVHYAPMDYTLGRPACPPPCGLFPSHSTDADMSSMLSSRGSVDEVLQMNLNKLLKESRENEMRLLHRQQRRKVSTVAPGNSDEAECVLGMLDEHCDLYSLDRELERSIQESEDNIGPSLFEHASIGFPVHVLNGKRGRRYTEVWAEEDYLNSVVKKGTRADGSYNPVVSDWSEVIHMYCDDHDRPYIDWLCEQKRLLAEPQPLKKLKATSQASAMKDATNSNCLAHILAPPVPVSCHHPACWGPESRRKYEEWLDPKDSRAIDVQRIHPASVSTTNVKPICGRNNNPFDELELISSVASARLFAIAQSNVLTLSKVLQKCHHSYSMATLNNWKRRLQNCLDSIVGDVLIPSSDRSTPLGAQTAPNDITYMNLNPAPDRRQGGPYDTSAIRGIGSQNVNCINVNAGCQDIDKNNSPVVLNIAIGNTVEICTRNTVGRDVMPASWGLGTIARIIKDGDLVRYIKVTPLGQSSADNVVLAIDDSNLAPLGTNIPLQTCRLVIEQQYAHRLFQKEG